MITSGIIPPVIVRLVLENAEDIDSAIRIIKRTKRIGACSMLISDHKNDKIAYIEYDGADIKIRKNLGNWISTNHSLFNKNIDECPEHSLLRLKRMRSLLKFGDEGECTIDWAKSALRDVYDLSRQRETPHPTMNTLQIKYN